LEELRRYYYVTPTSYLELITSFKGLLDKKRDIITSEIYKFEKGLKQLAQTQETVNKLQIDL